MVHNGQVQREQRRRHEQQDRKDTPCHDDDDRRQNNSEGQFSCVEAKDFTEPKRGRVFGGYVEHGTTEGRLERSTQADEVHRAVEQRRVQQVGKQVSLPHTFPVGDDVVEHRCDQEQQGRHEHPEWVLEGVTNRREDDGVDDDVQAEEPSQRQRVREQDDVQFLEPPHVARQDFTRVSPDELHVSFGPLAMPLLEGHVVKWILLLAHDIRGEDCHEASPSSRDREADVLSNHVWEAADCLIALSTHQCAMTKQRHEAVSVLDELICRPV